MQRSKLLADGLVLLWLARLRREQFRYDVWHNLARWQCYQGVFAAWSQNGSTLNDSRTTNIESKWLSPRYFGCQVTSDGEQYVASYYHMWHSRWAPESQQRRYSRTAVRSNQSNKKTNISIVNLRNKKRPQPEMHRPSQWSSMRNVKCLANAFSKAGADLKGWRLLNWKSAEDDRIGTPPCRYIEWS